VENYCTYHTTFSKISALQDVMFFVCSFVLVFLFLSSRLVLKRDLKSNWFKIKPTKHHSIISFECSRMFIKVKDSEKFSHNIVFLSSY